jgi:membrane protease YdiL (CAAX protease family)
MSASSLNKQSSVEPSASTEETVKKSPRSRWWVVLAVPLWVVAGFGLAQAVLVGLVLCLRAMGVPFETINPAVLNASLAAISYVLSVIFVAGLPWWIKKYRTTKEDVGLTRLPSWMDVVLAPAGGVVYIVCSIAILAFVKAFVPAIDLDQTQQTGFANLSDHYEYVLAFVTLIIVAPVFEEILFRGYLYGKIRKVIPAWLAITIVSIVFAAVHGQWNVSLDVFALSIVLCSLREMTGSIWAGVLLHMCKNGLAFYFLFINPDLLRTMGG